MRPWASFRSVCTERKAPAFLLQEVRVDKCWLNDKWTLKTVSFREGETWGTQKHFWNEHDMHSRLSITLMLKNWDPAKQETDEEGEKRKHNRERWVVGLQKWRKKNPGFDWWALILTNHQHNNTSNHFDVSPSLTNLVGDSILAVFYPYLHDRTLEFTLNAHTLMLTETTNRRKHQKKPHLMMDRGLNLNTSKKFIYKLINK